MNSGSGGFVGILVVFNRESVRECEDAYLGHRGEDCKESQEESSEKER